MKKQNGEPIDIVCTCDNVYAKYCLTMLLSLLDNNKESNIRIHIIGHKLEAENKKHISDSISQLNASIAFYEINENLISALPKCINHYITPITYGRLFLSSILPEYIHKVLYLDCDILVVGSISRLFDIEMNNSPIAAVEDLWSGKDVHYDRLGISKKDVYFNGGVLLLNLDYWRKKQLEEKILSYINSNHERILLADQDALNGIFHDNKILLPLRYNLQDGFFRRKNQGLRENTFDNLRKEIDNPIIIHFSYKKKPWTYKCFHPYRKIFFNYYDKTPWKNDKPTMTIMESLDRLAYAFSSFFHLTNGYIKINKEEIE